MSVNIYKDSELIPIAGNGGGDVPDNIVLFEDDETIPEEPLPRDADLLAGREPSYYAKQTDVDKKATVDEVNKNWQGNGYNLIPFPYSTTSKTINGVTFTVNEDGSILLNGKPTANILFYLAGTGTSAQLLSNEKLKKGTYAICSNYRDSKIWLKLGMDAGTYKNQEELNTLWTIEEDSYFYFCLRIDSAHDAFNNMLIYPMLVKVNDDGTYPKTYQRYAQGNVQLTDKVKQIDNSVNEINQNLTNKTTWKLLGEFGHNISANISNLEYDELLIVFHARTDKYGYGTLNIPRLMLDSNERIFQGGYYSTTSDYTIIAISATTNALRIDSCKYNGSFVTNENMKIFYR